MRKARKQKRGKNTCQMCKAYKHGYSGRWENRWKPKEFVRLRADEREMREAVRR